jgi:hypothetical protein
LIDNKGNVYTEEQYEGYGEFGKKDIFILFAEMNHLNIEPIFGDTEESHTDRLRCHAISHWYSSNSEYIYPNIVENIKFKWVNKIPKDDPEQGSW